MPALMSSSSAENAPRFSDFLCRRPDICHASVQCVVAAAVRSAAIPSARVHFAAIGGEEFRAPSLAYAEDVAGWAKALGKV
jgi:hypothetical protein